MKNSRSRLLLGAAAGIVSVVTLAPLPAMAADGSANAGDSRDRDDIVVTGVRSLTDAISGTKTNLPLAETPQSISVVDASTIAELGMQNLNQALRLVAGVTPETRGSSAEVYDQFKLRGFDVDTYLDGLKQYSSKTGYAAPQVDMSRLDRIEVVKGSASALYGASSPGGLVNEQSKLPIDRDFYGAASVSYGNYDSYRIDGDIGGKIGSGVLWRVYGSANGADTQQDYGKRKRETASAAVTLGAGTSTDFTVLAAYSHDPYNGNYGAFPSYGTLDDNATQGKISTSFYGGEPNDFFKREQFGLTYIFNHDFGDGWKLRSAGRYQYVKTRLGLVYVYTGSGYVTDTDYTRYSYATNEQLNTFTYDTQLTGLVKTGAVDHNLLFGVDRQVAHSSELYAFGGATDINAYDPVYGTMDTPSDPYHVLNYDLVGYTTPTLTKAQQRQQGLYAQDQISAGGLRVLLSGRYDWARSRVDGTGRDDQKFTYRAAALYKTSIGLSPYVAWSTSFEPQTSSLQDGSIAKPTTGKSLEAGVKYQLPGTDILLSAAYFHIDQSNLVVTAPLTSYVTQAGKVRSQGVEVEAAGSLPFGFDFRLAFSRQSVKDIQDTDESLVGKSLAVVGKGGTSFNLNWTAKEGPLEGVKLGGVVRHVDETYAGDSIYTPGYTVFDALLRYNLGKAVPRLSNVTLGVNATNIFDKTYITSCYAAYGWCWYGNRRTVQGTIGFTW
ncbi:putative TonB-dependent receptor [Novosphingobium sp. Rr 2-17]|uniref:TonB-dependent siderophore receptor n=1 Tax=Novosphingobium sp. Rr 2-17 TaxID=555793 RepID=UPI0002699C17|nr:TonB-dependent siderophore receptor [Novosphingobium sp. Rr 2-17]EIZ77430.1 putative TonB-dependent receptor [Novosphingobium sp. Rr 2-17]